MAIFLGTRHFRTETEGREFIIFTDHSPLVAAFRTPSLTQDPVATNQIMEVSLYTSDVRYVSGRSNVVADALSRPSDVPLGTGYQVKCLVISGRKGTGPRRRSLRV